jgi:hypothetical protein
MKRQGAFATTAVGQPEQHLELFNGPAEAANTVEQWICQAQHAEHMQISR